MKRILRKSKALIVCDGNCGPNGIQIINTEIEFFTNYAVFRTILKPAGGNQKRYAGDIFKDNKYSVNKFTIEDNQIRTLIGSFLSEYENKIEYLKFDIEYDNISYLFNVKIERYQENGISLIVEK